MTTIDLFVFTPATEVVVHPRSALDAYARDLARRTGISIERARAEVNRHMPQARSSAQATFGEGANVAPERWRQHVLDYIVSRVKP